MLSGIGVVGAALILSACASVETQEPSTDLAPEPAPERAVGWSVITDRNAERVTWELVEQTEQGLKYQASNGCSYVSSGGDQFAPVASWSNCGGSSGLHNIVSQEGSVWPLKVGNTAAWTVNGETGSENWSTTKRCSVREAVSLTVPAGTYDAYHVACRDDWNRHTYYYAPEVDATIYFKRVHKQRGVQVESQMAEAPNTAGS